MNLAECLAMLRAILFLILANCAPVAAQTCTKPESDTPIIRGFKLGMTVTAAKTVYQYISDEKDETGYFSVDVTNMLLPESQAKGIAKMNLGFLDDRLVSIIIVYDEATTWESVDQFAAAVSKTLGIPLRWTNKTRPNNPQEVVGLQVVCGEITYGVGTPNGVLEPFKSPTLLIFRNDTKPIREARRAIIEERKRQTFRP